MKILAFEQELPGSTKEAFEALGVAEAQAVWRLHQAGQIRELYFRSDRNEAVLSLECNDVAEAEIILAQLPFVASGLIRFDLVPLRAYPGFERLFKPVAGLADVS